MHPIIQKHFEIPKEETITSARDEAIINYVKLKLKDSKISMEPRDGIPQLQIDRNENDEPT